MQTNTSGTKARLISGVCGRPKGRPFKSGLKGVPSREPFATRCVFVIGRGACTATIVEK